MQNALEKKTHDTARVLTTPLKFEIEMMQNADRSQDLNEIKESEQDLLEQ